MNYHSDEWIQKKVNSHYDYVARLFQEKRVIGAFYRGSANYRLDTEDSDVDTIVLIAPSIDDIVECVKPISQTVITDKGEHIDIKDFRLFIGELRKMNPGLLEILFTKFFKVNKDFDKYFMVLRGNNEIIARYNRDRLVSNIYNMGRQAYQRLEVKTPRTEDIINGYGYNPKNLYHLIRMEKMLKRYINGGSFRYCLDCGRDADHLAAKRGEFSKEEAIGIADDAYYLLKDHYRVWNSEPITSGLINLNAAKVLKEVNEDLIKDYMKKELTIS